MPLPNDHLERVYAGVLGKIIGVYLGRPFEGWTHERIMAELGEIDYYVHERLGQPLIVTDDDVAGTFTFVRALEDYGVSEDLSARDIGRAWLNYIIEHRTILWWGGNGNSTEHTAWLNLRNGIPAPASGATATNGQTVAEQIGAQIFIDGWALVAPGRPALAARLAEQAGKVSHDGASVHAAMLWAAMEAEAFVSSDIDHLIDTGLGFIPADGIIARLIADIRAWHRAHPDDWLATRQKIADNYGYDRYPGNCHVVPNHALMIMAVLHAPDDFQRAQMIVNTAGWDTDCNAGNVGCLLGIMHGLDGLAAGPDWRGPVADRLLISSADGGSSINDAVRIAHYLTGLGRRLAGEAPLPAPKDGARFHFSLPGSVQGFRARPGGAALGVGNAPLGAGRALSLDYEGLAPGLEAVATTPTFSPPEVLAMRTYDLMASPLVYPGQTVRARLVADPGNTGAVTARLRLSAYDGADRLRDVDGDPVALAPGADAVLDWRLPDLDGQPIAEIGVALTTEGRRADGTVRLDWLRWDGTPELRLHRPEGDGDFWRMAWVNGVSIFSKRFPPSFRISQDRGEGVILHGTAEWTDYRVESELVVNLATHAGLVARAGGLRRYYAARLHREGRVEIVRVRDEETKVLAEAPFAVEFETPYAMSFEVSGPRLTCRVGGVELVALDESDRRLASGAIGLLVADGALSTEEVRVSPLPG